MANIEVLSKEVSNLIAAGEVVERPASVVKELVENSIDAGAGEIIVDVESGGLDRIVVTDDGCGMDKADLALCIERHATSKVKGADDLNFIKTMGFRGEALPSIAAISKMKIESKSVESGGISGNVLYVEAGQSSKIEDVGWAEGTRITVADLFFNVPARKKFLRTARTELGHIKDMMERLALANPGIRFKFVSDGKELLGAYSLNDQKQRTSEVLGGDVVKKSYECDYDAGELRLYGLVGDPSLARAGTKGIYWFVNGRPVKDRLLNHALGEAYRSLVPRGLSPFSMLFIKVPTGMVDVNVHPTKSEVKFLKGNAIHSFVLDAVRRTLGMGYHDCHREGQRRKDLVESTGLLRSARNDTRETISDGSERTGTVPVIMRQKDHPASGSGVLQYKYRALRPIGQLHNTYIICEGGDGTLALIDQHAAHERIGYEKLKRDFENASVGSQGLLVPEVVEVPSKAVGYLEEALEDLNRLGWEIEFFGGDTFSVKAVPVILGNINVTQVITSLAQELAEYSSPDTYEERIDRLMKVTACHAQVRGGDKLSMPEMEALLKEMDRFEWSGRCPHGRPAIVEFSLSELEKKFLRRG